MTHASRSTLRAVRMCVQMIELSPSVVAVRPHPGVDSLAVLAQGGETHQVLYRRSKTDGRRFAVWGFWRSTYIHVRISALWFLGCSHERLRREYDTIYRDDIR